jgi:hypothetical protein
LERVTISISRMRPIERKVGIIWAIATNANTNSGQLRLTVSWLVIRSIDWASMRSGRSETND